MQMKSHYGMLALNLVLSAIVMYAVMFTMIDTPADFYNNLNTFYMTMTMVAPMGILMLATMGGMYMNKRLNLALYAGFALVLAAGFFATRTQAFIGDKQFIHSMIPHHSGAILMCREAQIDDAELQELCRTISTGQRQEIEQMRAILERLG